MTAIESSKLNPTTVVYFCAAAAVCVPIIVLCGWFFDVSYLKSLLPGYPQMQPNTAVALWIGGAGLLLSVNSHRREWWIYIPVFCGIAVFLIGSLTLGEYITGLDFGIDTLLLPAESSAARDIRPGRMGPHAAFNLAILGVSLTLLTGRRSLQRASELFAVFLLISTFGALLGHLYSAEQLYGVLNYSNMALHTAGLFLLCSFGLFAANTGSRTVRLLLSDSVGGSAARRLLPVVVLVPTFFGWLRVLGQGQGFYDTGFGATFTILSSVVLMFALTFYYSERVHEVDLRRKEAEQGLAEKETRFRELFNYSQGMICIHDLEGRLSTVNPAAALSLGYSAEELVGKNLRDLMAEENQPQFSLYLRQVENEGIATGLLALVSKQGKTLIWRYNNILASEPGKEPYILAHAQDVTELIAAQKALKNLSLTDELTGLYNRRGFLTLAEQQVKLERHEGTARGLVLMFADLDGLKKINDIHGHEAGSDAIVQFSKILKAVLRSADLIARWGGDEFVILTIGSLDEHVGLMSDRIYERLDEYNAVSRKPYLLECSIGVAPVPTDGDRTFESIIAEADEAMYAEKRRRKEMAGSPV